MQDINCELTPLTNNGRGRGRKCVSNGTSGRYGYYLDFVRHIWLEISTFFWKLVIFLLLLIIINTILRSIFVKETSLMFTSSVKGQSNGLSIEHYAITKEERAPHLFWIVTDLELSANTKYPHQLTKQGILLENYHISQAPTSISVNRVSALISKYAHRMTLDDVHALSAHSTNDNEDGEDMENAVDVEGDDDVDDNDDVNEEEDGVNAVIISESEGAVDDGVWSMDSYFDAFDVNGYRVETLSHFEMDSFTSTVNGIATDSPPLLMYIEMDDVGSLRTFDAEIGRIVSYLKRRESLEVWQNSLLIISSDSNPFSLLCGPRIPNKQRGIRSHALFDVTDWQQTLLHFSTHHQYGEGEDIESITSSSSSSLATNEVDGFDLWDTIIYGAQSPRTEIPKEIVENVQVVTREVVIT